MTNQFPGDFNAKSSALVTGDYVLIADSEDSNEVKSVSPQYIFPGGSILGNAENNTIGASTTNYMAVGGSRAPGATELDYRVEWSPPGTLSRFYVRTRSAQPGTGSLVFTVRVAAADTTLVVTVAAGSAAGIYSDTTHTETIGAVQGLSIKVVNNASGASAQIAGYSIKFTQ